MSQRDLLDLVAAQVSPWDSNLAGRSILAMEGLAERLVRSELSHRTVEAVGAVCTELADMARHCLVLSTGFEPEDFETISDCLHAKDSLPPTSQGESYSRVLIDVLSSCLFVRQCLEDGDGPSPAEAYTLVAHIERLEVILESREVVEAELQELVEGEREVRQAKIARHQATMQKARDGRAPRHDWAAVAKTERELEQAGRSQRDFAAIIEQRHGIPPTTYREWRRRKATE